MVETMGSSMKLYRSHVLIIAAQVDKVKCHDSEITIEVILYKYSRRT